MSLPANALQPAGARPRRRQARDVSRAYGKGDAAVRPRRRRHRHHRGPPHRDHGPSGSGKSTLMHILAGLDQPTGGRVSIDGVEITRLKEKKLTQLRRDKIGFIFQSFNLLATLTADENIVLPLSLARRRADEAWRRAVIEAVALEDRRPTARPSPPAASSSGRPSPPRSSPGRPCCSPTSPWQLRLPTGGEVLELPRRSVDEFGETIIMVTTTPGREHRRPGRVPQGRPHRARQGPHDLRRDRRHDREPRGEPMTRLAFRSLASRRLRTVLTPPGDPAGRGDRHRHERADRPDRQRVRQHLRDLVQGHGRAGRAEHLVTRWRATRPRS